MTHVGMSWPELCSRLGLPEPRRSGAGKYRAAHQAHNGANPTSLSLDEERGYHCFACGEAGDKITFVQRALGLDFRGAISWLGIDGTPGAYQRPKPTPAGLARIGLQTWVADRGRCLRDAHFCAERALHRVVELLRHDPDDARGWELLEAFSRMQDNIGEWLDGLESPNPGDQLEAYRAIRSWQNAAA